MAYTSGMLGLAIALACLQVCSGQSKLTEVARTYAMGGQCERVMIANDQQHALSVGPYGDLVWWDMKSRQPVSHIPGPWKHRYALALHPSKPLAAVSSTIGKKNGTVHAVNLATGETKLWLDVSARVLAFNAAGDRLAASHEQGNKQRLATYRVEQLNANMREPIWRKNWHTRRPHNDLVFVTTDTVESRKKPRSRWLAKSVLSADAKITASHNKQVMTIGKASFPLTEFHGGWAGALAVTNDGTALAGGMYGNMLVAKHANDDRQVFAPHLGHADRMVFSPDGSHLAIMSLSALRIVDLAGNERIALPDTHIASPGTDGAEFWIASHTGAWRWNAASQTEVGSRVTWRGEGVQLIRDLHPVSDHSTPPFRLGRLGIAQVVKQGAWLCARDTKNSKHWLVKQTATEWLANERPMDASPTAIHVIAGTHDVLFHGNELGIGGWPSTMSLQRLDANGKRLHRWQASGNSDWFVVNDSGTTAWLASSGDLYGLACKDVRDVVHHTDGPKWDSGIAWHDDNLLVTDGKALQVINPMTLEQVRSFDVPRDLTELDLIAASPNRSHVAIASGSEVRIMRMPR